MNKVKFYRLQQGYLLKDLAGMTGLSMGHLSRIENGSKQPSKSTMESIARSLGRTVPEVFYAGTDDKAENLTVGAAANG